MIPNESRCFGDAGVSGVQGGVEKHCENLYPQLVKKGCKIVVFTRKPYGNSAIENYKGVKLIPLSCPKNKFLEAFVHTFRGVFAAKKIKPDILHIHAVGPSLFVPLARMLGLRVVMTHHGPDYERKKWNWLGKAVIKGGEKWGCICANAVVCISKTIAQSVQQKYGRLATVIPNGVEVYSLSESQEALGKYGVEKGKYILAVSRFVPEKGLHDLIEAFGIASASATPRNDTAIWKLVIVGDADHEDKYSLELKRKAKENANIVLTGFLSGEPLQELYSHAGLFVLPSYYEGLPIVLLEAMSYGLSCVVSDIPANREVELAEARYFKAGAVEGMAKKLREFMGRPLSAEEKNAQIKLVAERYDWGKIAEETLKVYVWVRAQETRA